VLWFMLPIVIYERGDFMPEDKLKEYVINRFTKMTDLLSYAGFQAHYEGTVFCPFHSDEKKKSAKIYNDEDGDKLWCFAERRMYFPIDVFKHNLIDTSAGKLFESLWNNLDDESKQLIKKEFSEHSQSPNKPNLEKYRPLLIIFDEFKGGGIDYDDLSKGVSKYFRKHNL